MAIVKGSGLLMRAIIEEAPQAVLERMQILALSEGALLKQMHTATFTRSTDQRLLTHRELARQLVSISPSFFKFYNSFGSFLTPSPLSLGFPLVRWQPCGTKTPQISLPCGFTAVLAIHRDPSCPRVDQHRHQGLEGWGQGQEAVHLGNHGRSLEEPVFL